MHSSQSHWTPLHSIFIPVFLLSLTLSSSSSSALYSSLTTLLLHFLFNLFRVGSHEFTLGDFTITAWRSKAMTQYSLHRSFLYSGLLYVDLRNAIRNEEGPHIFKHWAVLFLAMNKKNYARGFQSAGKYTCFPKAYCLHRHSQLHCKHAWEGRSWEANRPDAFEHYNL